MRERERERKREREREREREGDCFKVIHRSLGPQGQALVSHCVLYKVICWSYEANKVKSKFSRVYIPCCSRIKWEGYCAPLVNFLSFRRKHLTGEHFSLVK